MRRISRYSGLNFQEILNLPYSYFLLLNRESWIESYMMAEGGSEILKTLWRLQQTEPDLKKVRERIKKESDGGNGTGH